jgi:nitroimidazol reductase NimA-like FMN-containing flavoprotein (pyridoxamine 5'-phosphate oxidase superfamily)
MFKEMRRSDKMLNHEEMLDILENTEYGVLSTIGENGFPYGVPVNFVYKDDTIYFHSALVGHKLENISYNSKVSFCVVKDVELIPDDFNTKFKSVIVFGEVTEVEDIEKNEIFKLLLKKFSKDFMKPGMDYVKKSGSSAKIFRIKIKHITAKGKK